MSAQVIDARMMVSPRPRDTTGPAHQHDPEARQRLPCTGGTHAASKGRTGGPTEIRAELADLRLRVPRRLLDGAA